MTRTLIFFALVCIGFFIHPNLSAQSIKSARKKIIDFTIQFDSTAPRAPGSIIGLGITAKKRNGKIVETKGYLNGTMPWTKFGVEVTGGKFWNNSIEVGSDQDMIDNKVVITVYPLEDPSFRKYLYIPIDYTGDFVVNLSGINGRDGQDGRDGQRSEYGGGDGCDGNFGEDGTDASNLEVLVKLVEENNHQLLYILVHNLDEGDQRLFKLNVSKGSFTILNTGGNGGNGGDGGDGGNGVDKASGGNGGDGGYGGDGGNGGRVKIIITPEAQTFLPMITVKNGPGEGGKGGRKGQRGSAGSGYQVSEHKTIVGKLLADKGNGNSGLSGNDGRRGIGGGDPEIIVGAIDYNW